MKNKDTLYARWLSGDISAEELQQLKNDGVLEDLERIIQTSDQLSIPNYDTAAGIKRLRAKRGVKEVPIRRLTLRRIASVAAGVLLLAYVGYNLISDKEQEYFADHGSTEEVRPGDGSIITMNDGSSINYDYSDWDKERKINLTGEALFDVQSGSPFIVSTDIGNIRVLGTQFNVKSWGDKLYVACYEGKVEVSAYDQQVILTKGESVAVLDRDMSDKQMITEPGPSWINGISKFQEEDIQEVFDEIKRQYDVEVTLPDLNRKFTGQFSHDNLENAVSNICRPLGLRYTISADGSTVQVESQ